MFVLRSSGDTLSRENFYKLKARIAEARMLASGIHGRGGNVVDFDMPDDKEQEPEEPEQGKSIRKLFYKGIKKDFVRIHCLGAIQRELTCSPNTEGPLVS